MKKLKVLYLLLLSVAIFVIFYEALLPGNISEQHSNKVKDILYNVVDVFKNEEKKSVKYYKTSMIINEDEEACFNNNENLSISLRKIKSFTENTETVKTPDKEIKFFGDEFTIPSFIRKLVGHFLAFFVLGILGFLCTFSYISNKYLAFGVNATLGFYVALISELLQLIPAGRVCNMKDVVIDFTGYLLAGLLMLIFYFLKSSVANRKLAKE